MRTKNHLLCLFVLTASMCIFQNVKAEVLHWPQLCTNINTSKNATENASESAGDLYIKNKDQHDITVWLQKFGKTLLSETEIVLTAKSELVFPLEALNKDERYSLLNMNTPNNSSLIEVQYKCHDQFYNVSPLEGGDLTFKKSDLVVNKIWIQNLFTDVNSVRIEFLDLNYKKIAIENISLPASDSTQFSVPDRITNWTYFKISTSHKSSVFNLTSTGADRPIRVAPQKTQVNSNAFYFLMESRFGASDSFVVQITDPVIAEKARDLVQNPKKEKILFARIQKDHQGFNRNWSQPEKNFWSWSTSEVTGFGDLGSTACNGAPQEVEDRVDFWIEDPGQICFWNYRVRRELSVKNVETGN